jgi:hypothetical protein
VGSGRRNEGEGERREWEREREKREREKTYLGLHHSYANFRRCTRRASSPPFKMIFYSTKTL